MPPAAPAFALAIAASATLILSAAFISQVRNYIREAFPGQFVPIIGGVVGLSVVLAIAAALLRIRTHRAARYSALGAALTIALGYTLRTSSPDPQIAWVERFHFVQYGLITFLFYRAWRPLGDPGALLLPVIAAMLTGTVEEWFQWFIPGRVGVMEDVFLNWVAIGCGLLFSVGFDPPASLARRMSARSTRQAGAALAAFVVVFGMFFDAVHLGHAIRDPQAGTFASIYTANGLRAHAAERRERWAASPPVDRTRLAREDQYRTEGIQHVQERNRAWDRGDIEAAWRENLILETYYGPVLERGHQWPDGQRQDALARIAAIDDARYVSAAYPYHVYFWPAWIFWGIVLAVAAASLVLTRHPRR